MLQGNESLAEIGATSLLQFIVSSAGRLPTREWVIIIERIDEIVAANGVSLRTALSDELGVKFNDVDVVAGDDDAGQSLDQPDSNNVVNESDEIVENNNETKDNDDDNNADEQPNDNDNNDSNNNIDDNIDDKNNSDDNNNDDDDDDENENEKENNVEQQTSSEIEIQPKPVLESVPSTPSNIKFAEADEDKAVFSVKVKMFFFLFESLLILKIEKKIKIVDIKSSFINDWSN